ncbi:hypothetical protein ACIBG8_11855 [Nonomuraea sp. NPDC050556]|uniref:hypothetical protein n=1 Tax=Nonomuraea sp. NPDC050556 TaxID=3364369 RepID=UPI00378AE43F
MIKLAERMLSSVLPQATASAGCTPTNWCDHCGGSYYKRIFFRSDCTVDYTACNNPCPWY